MAEYAVPGIVGCVPTRTGLPTGPGAAIAAAHTTVDKKRCQATGATSVEGHSFCFLHLRILPKFFPS